MRCVKKEKEKKAKIEGHEKKIKIGFRQVIVISCPAFRVNRENPRGGDTYSRDRDPKCN